MTLPAREALRLRLQRREQRHLIEFDKSRGPQLGARLRPSSGSGRRPGRAAGEPLEKLVQMELERFEGFLQHEQHDAIKRQFALACKGAWRGAMARPKAAIGEQRAHRFDDEDSRDFDLHPHAEMKSR